MAYQQIHLFQAQLVAAFVAMPTWPRERSLLSEVLSTWNSTAEALFGQYSQSLRLPRSHNVGSIF